jgi:hypothetical protein
LVKIYIEYSKDLNSEYNYLNKEIHYDKNGKKIFEGKTYGGKYYQGKLYNNIGDLIYDGFFKDNKYSRGKLYKRNGKKNILIYDGEFFDGKYSGRGAIYDEKYGV